MAAAAVSSLAWSRMRTAWVLTAGLWALAGFGILSRIFLPSIGQKVWVVVYLGMAWIGGIAVFLTLPPGANPV